MKFSFTNPLQQVFFILIITLISVSVSYSQENQNEKKLPKDIQSENNAKDQKNADSLKILNDQINAYSKLGEYEKALEINLKVVELSKTVLGERHPDYLIYLNNLAQAYATIGDYQKALEIQLKVVELKKEVLGEKNSSYLLSLNNLALAYSNLEEYQKALGVYLEVVESKKEVLGEKNASYLVSLSGLAYVYSKLGNSQKALEIYLNVAEARKEVLGEKSPVYLKSLTDLASEYEQIGNYKKAIEINLELAELRKEMLGENHPDYLKSLNKLIVDYSNLGDNIKALEISLKVVELRKEILGENNPDYLTSLNNLAVVYLNLGDYKKSLETNLKVVELRKEVLGEKHRDYITSLNNLAWGYTVLGDYVEALEINLKAVELGKEVLGEEDNDYIISMGNLSSTYSLLGDYQKALSISLKVSESIKKVSGEMNLFYLTSLNNVASNYTSLGELEKALEIIISVVKLRKEILGEKHIDYLMSLNSLARAYLNLEDYSKAMEISLNSVEQIKQVLGEKHPYYLDGMNILACEYSNLGDYQKALWINQKVVEIGKEVWGEKNPEYLSCLVDLAITEINLSENDSAFSHYLEMINNKHDRVTEYFGLMTEQQREQLWTLNSEYFIFFPLFLEKIVSAHPEAAKETFDVVLFSKGLLLNTTIDFDKLIAEKGTPEAIAKFADLKLIKLEIQHLTEKPIAERYLNVDSLENIAQQKETELVKLSKEYGDYTGNLKINWKDVQANLHDKDVAIEFVEYPTLTDTVKYAALVLRKGWQYPRMISLFRKDQVDDFIKQDKDKIYSKYIGKELKKLIWSPLEKVVSPGEKVYFSPAGIIHQLAIENLPFDDTTTLGDRYQMYRLSSTKELALHKEESHNQLAVLYGGLQYDLPEEKMMAESKKYEKPETLYAMRGYTNDTAVRSGWKFLEGTKPEVDKISQLMKEKHYQVMEFTGETGNEESFKSLSGKKEGIIHIATHGFFQSIDESRKNIFMMQRIGDQQQEKAIVDPMLRSGLILAGGNKAWQGEKIPENIEDGVLTAREISRMDLRGTDLVVLSACETGLGEVSSEGVFGLQRSFKQAGVQTLVMSLWQVNDEATRYLMTEFYSGLLSGKDKREAFLEAKQKCKKEYPYPKLWAAFIMLD